MYNKVNNMFYCSGIMHLGEAKALRDLSIPVGISLAEYRPKLREFLLEGHSLDLFVDSGAFSEIEFKRDKRVIKNPITDELWQQKFSAYRELANIYGKSCVVVAPDAVGDQEESLNRLQTYKTQVRELLDICEVIVPIQKGDISLSVMYQKSLEIIMDDRIVAGIPMKKSAVGVIDYARFLSESEPPRVHLLGLSKAGLKWGQVDLTHKLLKGRAPKVTHDACRIRPLVGRGRPLTIELNKRKHLDRQQALYESFLVVAPLITKELKVDQAQMELFDGV